MPTSTFWSLVIPGGYRTSPDTFAAVSGGPGVSVVRTEGSRIGVPAADAAGANADAAAQTLQQSRASRHLVCLIVGSVDDSGSSLHRRVRHVVEAREEHVVVDDAFVVVLVEAALVSVRAARRHLLEPLRRVPWRRTA